MGGRLVSISPQNRFDLIFLMLDPQDEQFDRRLATHLVSLYHQSMAEEEGAHLDMAVLRDYIAFSRTYVHPELSEEAGQALIQAYVGERLGMCMYIYNCTVLHLYCV